MEIGYIRFENDYIQITRTKSGLLKKQQLQDMKREYFRKKSMRIEDNASWNQYSGLYGDPTTYLDEACQSTYIRSCGIL